VSKIAITPKFGKIGKNRAEKLNEKCSATARRKNRHVRFFAKPYAMIDVLIG